VDIRQSENGHTFNVNVPFMKLKSLQLLAAVSDDQYLQRVQWESYCERVNEIAKNHKHTTAQSLQPLYGQHVTIMHVL